MIPLLIPDAARRPAGDPVCPAHERQGRLESPQGAPALAVLPDSSYGRDGGSPDPIGSSPSMTRFVNPSTRMG